MTKKITNSPPKGTADWFGEEMVVRKYIFDNWRRVCRSFGYKEYMTPVLERAEIYEAKSGEDVGKKELMTLTDQAGRRLAVRPEMTPSVVRLVSRIYDSEQKPIRLFSIANFVRNEKPQKGRNREFWQLNFDIFGSNSILADVEVVKVAIEIMLGFGAPKKSFEIGISNRKLLDFVLNKVGVKDNCKIETVRILDKWGKLDKKEIDRRLSSEAGMGKDEIGKLSAFMAAKKIGDLKKNFGSIEESEGFLEVNKIFEHLKNENYGDFVRFAPDVIRGFDYYDGTVFEVFSKKGGRSLFGGGRYNGLAGIFGVKDFPAVGFAPGDETVKIFLEENNLLKKVFEQKQEVYYFPLLDESLTVKSRKLAQDLRRQGKIVAEGLEVQKIGKALKQADNAGVENVVIFGIDEDEKNVYKIKNMKSGKEEVFKIK